MSYSLECIRKNDRRANRQMDKLLEAEGIRRDASLDYSCGLFDEDGELVATASSFGSTLRCFAVSSAHRGEGLMAELVSHMLQRQFELGHTHIFVYTKTDSAALFASLGFYPIVQVDRGFVFLENRRDGFSSFCSRLIGTGRGRQAAIVMNANPFTRGHRYLVERAAAENDTVHVFVLSEDCSEFPTAIRRRLAQEGTADIPGVLVHDTEEYMISSATFPSYFFPDSEEAIRGHAALDAEIFARIANAVGISRRYVGEEPLSNTTRLYNSELLNILPGHGIECVVIPRLTVGQQVISAGQVRTFLHNGELDKLRDMVPAGTWQYLNETSAEK